MEFNCPGKGHFGEHLASFFHRKGDVGVKTQKMNMRSSGKKYSRKMEQHVENPEAEMAQNAGE